MSELEIASSNYIHGTYYRATPAHVFNEILRSIDIEHQNFVFLDLGSGKGLTLLLASEFPFKRITGVEFAPALHQIARVNISKYHSNRQKCAAIQSVCMDVVAYPFPDDPTVFYFYHPFEEPVMAAVLNKIRSSFEQRPRDIWILYYAPLLIRLLDSQGFLERVRSADNYVIYRSRLATLEGGRLPEG